MMKENCLNCSHFCIRPSGDVFSKHYSLGYCITRMNKLTELQGYFTLGDINIKEPVRCDDYAKRIQKMEI